MLGAAGFAVLFGIGEEPGVVAFVAVGDEDQGDLCSGLVEFEKGAGDVELSVIGVTDDDGDPGVFGEERLGIGVDFCQLDWLCEVVEALGVPQVNRADDA